MEEEFQAGLLLWFMRIQLFKGELVKSSKKKPREHFVQPHRQMAADLWIRR